MKTNHHRMPIDRATIKTKLRIDPDLIQNPIAYFERHQLKIRTAKPTMGKWRGKRSQNLKLDILAYRGIRVELRKIISEPLTDATIHFNPSVCLNGHNGAILSLKEFLDALGVFIAAVKRLLEDPNDWFDLLPGLRSGSPAYWSLLEVPFQCWDTDASIMEGFRNLQHPSIRTPARHWPHSILVGGTRSKLQLAVYHKADEMVAHGKLVEGRLAEYEHILRIEIRVKEEKLVHYIGNDHNLEMIDGVIRLVRFYPRDLIAGHRKCLYELRGVWSSDEPLPDLTARKQHDSLGRVIAQIALYPGAPFTFGQLLSKIKAYTGASSQTISELRKAGLQMLSCESVMFPEELLSDEAYRSQIGIGSKEIEDKICHENIDRSAMLEICKAYQPPDQPRRPLVEFPGYFRV